MNPETKLQPSDTDLEPTVVPHALFVVGKVLMTMFQVAIFIGAGFLLMAGKWELAFFFIAPALIVIPIGTNGISVRQRFVGCSLIALLYFGVFLWLLNLPLLAIAVIAPALVAIPFNSDDQPWTNRIRSSVMVLFGFLGFVCGYTIFEMCKYMLPLSSFTRNKSLGPLPLILFSVIGIPIGVFIGKFAIAIFGRLLVGPRPNGKAA